ncbi:alpha/beta hydrolase family protein [Phenylobacterium sp. VNQ135]|uniref:alpha/beta hydrolase family protein n=1 Tax=Phenylobacterium sp. VNQ135 TaxID=3400922 RepID=UPI003C00EBD3
MKQTIRGAFVACSLALTALAVAIPAAAQSPPTKPAMGQLGGAGPCTEGTGKSGYGNRAEYIWVKVPTGTGSPRTGGTCNDANRPVVLIAPGWGALAPSNYPNLVSDMVSNGFIVIYVNFSLYPIRPDVNYAQVLDGYKVATTKFNSQIGNRMDLANIGIWGHSLGAGMVPWLAKEISALGAGSNSLWLSSNATSWAFWVELTGPIDIPSHAHAQVIAYDQDTKTDHNVGIDVFEAYDIPDSQKDHIQIQSDGSYVADHATPTEGAANYLDWYGVHRNYQALADCARFGTNCNVDLTDMGQWSNGVDAKEAIVSDDPQDMGPADALVECGEDNGQGAPSRCGP